MAEKDKKIYRYPQSLFTDSTDYLQIGIVKYKPIKKRQVGVTTITTTGGEKKDISLTSLSGRRGDRNITGKELEKVILLPIPSEINQINAVDFDGGKLNSIAGAAVGGVMNIMTQGGEFSKSIGGGFGAIKDAGIETFNAVTQASGGIDGLKGFATRYLASKAVGIANIQISPDEILARSEGQRLNPNMELLFSAPTLRTFKFSFKMTPRDEDEAIEIRNIIRCFKKNSAPQVTNINNEKGDEGFLRTPNVFELTYKKGVSAHDYLHKFKQCFLESVSVNYTPDSIYTTYYNGSPVAMVMTLTFREIEPIYSNDYEDSSGVGY